MVLEVAAGCLRLMSGWPPVLLFQYYQLMMTYRMMEVRQKKLSE